MHSGSCCKLRLAAIPLAAALLATMLSGVLGLADRGAGEAGDTGRSNAAPANAAANPVAPLPALAPRQPGTHLSISDIRPITGFAINAHHISDLQLYLDSVDRIAELGANAIIVLTPMFQEKSDSSEIQFVPEKCATDEQLIAILQHAREKGLFTTLLPIVLIEHPGNKDWRGVIKPESWDQWWNSYDHFIDRFIAVANKADVDLLIVGSELNSTESQHDRWRHVIQRARDEFPGQIGYSANWDRYDKIDIWPMVDVMAVSSYFELKRDDPNAPVNELAKDWARDRDALLKAAKQAHKPLLLSEVGYPSVPWASAHPWNYVIKAGSEADHAAQARCWSAFFDAWTQTFENPSSPAAGFFGYFWSPYYHGDAWDTGYGIEGKPSYDIVKRGFAEIRTAARPKS